jgi:ferredoxin-NADP reductase
VQVTLHHTIQHTNDITTYYWQPASTYRFLAGQYADLYLAHDADSLSEHRWLSFSSSPTEALLAQTVRTGTSSFKQRLQSLQPGALAILSQPQGDFIIPLDETIPLVCIALGIGIAPFRSIINDLVTSHEKRLMTLYHVVPSMPEALFQDVWQIADITYLPLVGRSALDTTRLGAKTTSLDTHFYIAGPESGVIQVQLALNKQGIPLDRLVLDSFLGY